MLDTVQPRTVRCLDEAMWDELFPRLIFETADIPYGQSSVMLSAFLKRKNYPNQRLLNEAAYQYIIDKQVRLLHSGPILFPAIASRDGQIYTHIRKLVPYIPPRNASWEDKQKSKHKEGDLIPAWQYIGGGIGRNEAVALLPPDLILNL